MRRTAQSLFRELSSNRLRVLAYHEVDDANTFRQQLQVLDSEYSVIDAGTAIGCITAGQALPSRSVWITFDDGYRSVVSEALPVLQEFGMNATLFVNPGVIEAGTAQWWDLVKAAEASNPNFAEPLGPAGSLPQMKVVPDQLRREAVELARDLLGRDRVNTIARMVADRACLDEWVHAGMHVGNHTWDHPCLDMCSPEEQESQIADAADWLLAEGYCDRSQQVFAYPNGDRTEISEKILAKLDMKGACVFDHRLVSQGTNPLRISRLRVSASAPVERFKDIVSGLHPTVFGAMVLVGMRSRAPKSAKGSPAEN